MINNDFTMDELLSIPAFSKVFEYREFKAIQNSFLQHINEGSKIPATKLIGLLLQQYSDYCGISLGRRTIFYDYAWAVLEEHPELWNDQETHNGLCVLADHFREYIPGYNDSFDKFDVTILNAADYLVRGFNLLSENELEFELHPAFSFVMFSFFKNYQLIDMQELTESIEEHLGEIESV